MEANCNSMMPPGKWKPSALRPYMNRMVFFRSDVVWHAVRPAQAPRKSLTGWLLYQPSDVGAVSGSLGDALPARIARAGAIRCHLPA